jgi:hypothetical protein
LQRLGCILAEGDGTVWAVKLRVIWKAFPNGLIFAANRELLQDHGDLWPSDYIAVTGPMESSSTVTAICEAVVYFGKVFVRLPENELRIRSG